MLGQDWRPESDSENDSDYVPPPGAVYQTEESSLEDEQPESKRVRAEIPESSAKEEMRKKTLWESFQASVNEPSSSTAESAVNKKMIKVCKRYHFAGEEVTEVVEVPEDSPDAKKWPVWDSPDKMEVSASTSKEPVPPPPSENPNSAPVIANSSNPPPAAAAGKRPGPRKSKTRLPELLGRSFIKAKKLTTLDKSVMDWKAHVQSSENEALQDELETNRRGGGYLEKVEFLQRVDERKDAILDAANSTLHKSSSLLQVYDITPYTPDDEITDHVLDLINDARVAWPTQCIAQNAQCERGGQGVWRYVFDQETPSRGIPHYAADLFDNIPLDICTTETVSITVVGAPEVAATPVSTAAHTPLVLAKATFLHAPAVRDCHRLCALSGNVSDDTDLEEDLLFDDTDSDETVSTLSTENDLDWMRPIVGKWSVHVYFRRPSSSSPVARGAGAAWLITSPKDRPGT